MLDLVTLLPGLNFLPLYSSFCHYCLDQNNPGMFTTRLDLSLRKSNISFGFLRFAERSAFRSSTLAALCLSLICFLELPRNVNVLFVIRTMLSGGCVWVCVVPTTRYLSAGETFYRITRVSPTAWLVHHLVSPPLISYMTLPSNRPHLFFRWDFGDCIWH